MTIVSDPLIGCGHKEGLVGNRRISVRRGQCGVVAAAVLFGVGTALTSAAQCGLGPVGMLAVGLGVATMALVLLAITGEIEKFLTRQRDPRIPDRVLATVLFTDIVDSTRRAAELGDRGWHELLERHDQMTRAAIARSNGRVIKNTGDGFLATFDGPTCAVRCGTRLAESIPDLGISVRCGLHTGECETRGDDIVGIAVHMGARIAALAHPGEVLVSSTVKELVNGSGIAFQQRGTHVLNGIPGEWKLFAPVGRNDPLADALTADW